MLSENLVNLRKAKGLSQEDVAKELHVVRQTVSKWEKAQSMPDVSLLLALSAFYGVSVEELLGVAMTVKSELTPEEEALFFQNEQQVAKKRRNDLLWNIIGIIVALIVLWYLRTFASIIIYMLFS